MPVCPKPQRSLPGYAGHLCQCGDSSRFPAATKFSRHRHAFLLHCHSGTRVPWSRSTTSSVSVNRGGFPVLVPLGWNTWKETYLVHVTLTRLWNRSTGGHAHPLAHGNTTNRLPGIGAPPLLRVLRRMWRHVLKTRKVGLYVTQPLCPSYTDIVDPIFDYAGDSG
eukprot:1138951-Rhodomonas_salina.1